MCEDDLQYQALASTQKVYYTVQNNYLYIDSTVMLFLYILIIILLFLNTHTGIQYE